MTNQLQDIINRFPSNETEKTEATALLVLAAYKGDAEDLRTVIEKYGTDGYDDIQMKCAFSFAGMQGDIEKLKVLYSFWPDGDYQIFDSLIDMDELYERKVLWKNKPRFPRIFGFEKTVREWGIDVDLREVHVLEREKRIPRAIDLYRSGVIPGGETLSMLYSRGIFEFTDAVLADGHRMDITRFDSLCKYLPEEKHSPMVFGNNLLYTLQMMDDREEAANRLLYIIDCLEKENLRFKITSEVLRWKELGDFLLSKEILPIMITHADLSDASKEDVRRYISDEKIVDELFKG